MEAGGKCARRGRGGGGKKKEEEKKELRGTMPAESSRGVEGGGRWEVGQK
jgi:hypothetical protein